MNYYKDILYVLASVFLLVGFILNFDNKLSDYFLVSGSILFLLKSVIDLFNVVIKNKKYIAVYSDLGDPINF
jgi:hypothetical protein